MKNKEGFHKEYRKMRRKYKEVEKIEDWKNEKEKKYTGRSFEGEKKN